MFPHGLGCLDHEEASSSWLGWRWLPATPQKAEIPLKLRAAFISHRDRETNRHALPRRHFQKFGLWLLVDEMPGYPGPLCGERESLSHRCFVLQMTRFSTLKSLNDRCKNLTTSPPLSARLMVLTQWRGQFVPHHPQLQPTHTLGARRPLLLGPYRPDGASAGSMAAFLKQTLGNHSAELAGCFCK